VSKWYVDDLHNHAYDKTCHSTHCIPRKFVTGLDFLRTRSDDGKKDSEAKQRAPWRYLTIQKVLVVLAALLQSKNAFNPSLYVANSSHEARIENSEASRSFSLCLRQAQTHGSYSTLFTHRLSTYLTGNASVFFLVRIGQPSTGRSKHVFCTGRIDDVSVLGSRVTDVGTGCLLEADPRVTPS